MRAKRHQFEWNLLVLVTAGLGGTALLQAVVLTLQNGVDSVDEVAAFVSPTRVLGGSTYVAAALSAPGLIEQTGTHRRVVFGEVIGDRTKISDRVQRISDVFEAADITSEPVADNRDLSALRDGQALSLDTRFRLKDDVIGKTL